MGYRKPKLSSSTPLNLKIKNRIFKKTSCNRGSVGLVLKLLSKKTIFIASESRISNEIKTMIRIHNQQLYSKTSCIARQDDSKPIYPGLKAEKIAKKIYTCRDQFIVVKAGDSDLSNEVCEELVESTETQIREGKRVTWKGLCKQVYDHLNRIEHSFKVRTSFLLVTPDPDAYYGDDFRLVEIDRKGHETKGNMFACVGCGEEEVTNYINDNSGKIWQEDKSIDQVRSIIRDGFYKSAAEKKNQLTVGGEVVIFSWTVEEDQSGKKKLVMHKVIYPPLRNVLYVTLQRADLKVGFHLRKEWMKEYVFTNWNENAVKELVELKLSIEICIKFYPKVKHDKFYKRPKSEHPPSRKYAMRLQQSEDSTDFFVLRGTTDEENKKFCKKWSITSDATVIEDFIKFCNENRIKHGTEVRLFWEEETSTFNLWVARYTSSS